MKPIRCLLVDDHRILREGVRLLLERDRGSPPLEVAGEAESGTEALALLGELRPQVAVLDLALPGLGGLELCREARTRGARVVLLTMHVSAEHVRRAKEAGADGYVVKGSGVADLAAAIRRVVAGEPGPFPSVDDPIGELTVRERQVLVEVAQGRSNREIASRLGISIHTVNTHRIHVMEKLGVHDAIALARLAVQAGLLS